MAASRWWRPEEEEVMEEGQKENGRSLFKGTNSSLPGRN